MQIIAVISFLPVFLILYYIYKKDRDPEPIKTVGITFAFGAVSCIPAIILELAAEYALNASPLEVDTPIYNRARMFAGVALIEEVCKWCVVMLFIWKHKDFDDSYDAIVYCVTASLGFAALENLLYVVQNGLAVGIMRAVTSVPGHACFGVFMGYFLAKAKYHSSHGDKQKMILWMALALAVPVLVHGEYDYLLTVDMLWVFLGLIVIADIVAFVLIHHSFHDDHPIVIRETPLPPEFPTTPPDFRTTVPPPFNSQNQCDTN